MTTLSDIDVLCSICQTKSSQVVITSTSEFGHYDLDTRPPEMRRSTIFCWIQKCPTCGYCAPDLAECDEETKQVVSSDDYKTILSDTTFPELARSFLAFSLISEVTQQYAHAAWAAIHATWICDDKADAAARNCRLQAISKIRLASANFVRIAEDTGATEAITIDLYRRAGLFDEATKLIEQLHEDSLGSVIRGVVRYQSELIEMQDVSAHTIPA